MTTMTTNTQNRMRPSTGSHAQSVSTRVGAALVLLRAVIGVVFVAHGAQKLFVFGFGGVIGAFDGMGVPLAGLVAPAVALLEFFGGLALIAGLFTRLAALGLGAIMLGAITLVHLPAGFFAPNGVEFPVTLLGALVAIVLAGPGPLAVDALIARRRTDL